MAVNPCSNTADDLLAFELGILANTLMWHYDQAMYAVDVQQRVLTLTLIERIRAKASLLPQSASHSLNDILDKIQAALRCLDVQDFHETAVREMDDAANKSGELGQPTGSERYHCEMRLCIPEFREILNQAVIASFVTSPRHRWLVDVGRLVDSGRHPQNVAENIFGYEDITSSPPAAVGVEGVISALWSCRAPTERRSVLRTFGPGDLVPEIGWRERAQAAAAEIASVRPTDEHRDLTSAAAAANYIETTIRSFLAHATTCNASEAICGAYVAIDGPNSPTECAHPVVTHSQALGDSIETGSATLEVAISDAPDHYAVNQSETASHAAAADINQNDASMDASVTPDRAAVIANATEPTDTALSNCEPELTVGKWKFFDRQVQYAEFDLVEMSQPYRGILKCLLQRRQYRNWTHLRSAGWGEVNSAIRKNVVEAVSRLQNKLKEYLRPLLNEAFPEKSIIRRGRVDDLTYRIDDSLR